ncbi:Photosystem I chlorophyll a apoprotein A1 [Capsicum annuum]|nr:Photosystem I chlorophyll a apoprotein A1 [Capsicum annuum]
MLNHHLVGLLGLGSLSWAGHQVHVSLPINQFLNTGVDPKEIPLPHEFILNRDLFAQLYPSLAEGATPFFTLNWSKYADFLTFYGGLDPITGGLWLSDIAHHYLAIAILFQIVGHMYKTNWGIGHGLKDILEANKGPFIGQGHKGLYEILTTSWHAQLSLNLAILGSLTIIVAHHMYSMPPYPYLATDYSTQLSLFTHHMWIGVFLIVGAAVHAAIFMVRDYNPNTRYNNLLDRVLRHRDAIISHLNWALGGKVALLPIPLGTANFLVHYIHAFTIHVTVLILLKAVLFSHSSRLIPDKANLSFHFPCNGPGRGAWQGNFESWVQDPLHVRPIAHAIWDPHFGQSSVEAFTRGGALGPVNIAYSGVYQWWTFWRKFLGLDRHLVHDAIPASRGEYVRWNNFLDILPHHQGLGPLFTGLQRYDVQYGSVVSSYDHGMLRKDNGGRALTTLLEPPSLHSMLDSFLHAYDHGMLSFHHL